LLIASGQHEKALELCLEHNIPINEDMIEYFSFLDYPLTSFFQQENIAKEGE